MLSYSAVWASLNAAFHGRFFFKEDALNTPAALTPIAPALRLVLALLALTLLPSPAPAQTLQAQLVAAHLTQPLGVAYPPGDSSRLFIIEQTGRVRILDLTTEPPTLLPAPFLDLSSSGANLTTASGERGLLGLAFDPDYAANGYFYVNYTRRQDSHTVIARFRAFAPYATANTADPTTQFIFALSGSGPGYSIFQPYANHNGGQLAFGPDNMLYVGVGDGGSANDPQEFAQNTATLLGKILRLDVNDLSASDGDALFIPDNNPFRGSAAPLDEIWAIGLRNPWRLSFDRLTGDLYIGDVGQDAQEEINHQPALQLADPADGNSAILNSLVAGRNYGWDNREGLIAAPMSSADPDPDYAACTTNCAFTNPLSILLQSEGACSITGGYVYRGSTLPTSLQGTYFYADYCANRVFSFVNNNGSATDHLDWTSQLAQAGTPISAISSLGEDADGELYILSITQGFVYKIVPFGQSACGCPCAANTPQELIFSDTFTTDLGWTTSSQSTGAPLDGLWQRAAPITITSNYAYAPSSDSADAGTTCWLTENSDPGNPVPPATAQPETSDVDNGLVILTSPRLDFSGTQDITICYDYFLRLTAVGGTTADGLFVEVSTTGPNGFWQRINEHLIPTTASQLWQSATITQAQLTAAGLAKTNNAYIRFIAADYGNDTIVEAGVDNVRVYRALPDCNNNGISDFDDIAAHTSSDCNLNNIPDECDIASGLLEDFDGGPTGLWADGSTFFNTSCVGCHAPNGTGSTGPNIRNVSRETIRRRITLEIDHPGGGFPKSTPQDFANLEAFLADAGSRARPDRVPDSCQILPDCDNDDINDGKELQLATQVDADYDGIPDDCSPPCFCDFNHANGLTVQDIFDFLTAWLAGSPAADFNHVNAVTVQDIFDFLTCWLNGCG